MQWLANEVRAFRKEIISMLEAAKEEYRQNYIAHISRNGELERRLDRLEGEIKAMKMRMGKQKT